MPDGHVLRRGATEAPELPAVLSFYTLGMASVERVHIEGVLQAKLPKYPMPVALIGRLAVDARAWGQRFVKCLLAASARRRA